MAEFDRRWLHHPPEHTPYDELRLKRTLEVLSQIPLSGLNILDIGCGHGHLARHFSTHNQVTAIDGSSIPLQRLPPPITTKRATLPHLRLSQTYDLTICTDVLGELSPNHYRLAISEIASTTKGHALISTDLDTTTEAPLDHFIALLQTEFEILDLRVSGHRLHHAITLTLSLPSRFHYYATRPAYRNHELKGLSHLLTAKPTAPLWRLLSPLKKTPLPIKFLERVSRTLLGNGAITHAIALVCPKTGMVH